MHTETKHVLDRLPDGAVVVTRYQRPLGISRWFALEQADVTADFQRLLQQVAQEQQQRWIEQMQAQQVAEEAKREPEAPAEPNAAASPAQEPVPAQEPLPAQEPVPAAA